MPRGIDDRAIDRAVTRREAGAIWSATGLARRAVADPAPDALPPRADGLAAELALYRA